MRPKIQHLIEAIEQFVRQHEDEFAVEALELTDLAKTLKEKDASPGEREVQIAFNAAGQPPAEPPETPSHAQEA